MQPFAVSGSIILAARQFLPQPGGLIRLHGGPADLLHQQAGRSPAPGRGPSPPASRKRGPRASSRFSGSLCSSSGVTLRRLPIRGAHDDGLLHRLHVPAGADEFGGQPVEQFGMRRPFALRAEILHRLDQAGAEIHLPEAIHGHARRQRIGGIDQPFGEAQAIVRHAGGQRRQRRRERPARPCRRAGRKRRAAARASRAASGSPASPSRWGSCRSAARAVAQIQHLLCGCSRMSAGAYRSRKHQRSLAACAGVRLRGGHVAPIALIDRGSASTAASSPASDAAR